MVTQPRHGNTRQGYTYSIYAHIMDAFGPMRMIDILPVHVRDWITSLGAKHLSPSTIRLNKTILSAIFTTALNDQVTVLHACKGVKTPPVPRHSYGPQSILSGPPADQLLGPTGQDDGAHQDPAAARPVTAQGA
jgi:Phage integrase, N-terminal SAM-like domain